MSYAELSHNARVADLDKHERSCYLLPMTTATKGERTREVILDEALQLASVVGLEGLTIGALASRLGLSKSGLYAHFKSKDALQLAILQHGANHFIDTVVNPSLTSGDPVAALRTIFASWLEWSGQKMAGGCLFVTAIVEYDDRPGPVRDLLVQLHRRWLDFLGGAATRAASAGRFRADLDAAQFAHDFHAILLGFNQARRLLRDPDAEAKAHRAFQRLLADAASR